MNIEIPGYQIIRPLGRGAMGSVFLALQTSLQREVALKVLKSEFTTDESFRDRFLTEGRIVAQLQHPNIVTVHSIGEHDRHFYMELEYASDGTLSERIANRLPVAETTRIVSQIASALAYAHDRGFIHRDVKPSNILFRDDDSSLVSDFGIAKCLTSDSDLTMAGTAIGTPHYMSPEQAKGEAVTARSDLYSLGATFFEMLTGERPYTADSNYALALKHLTEPVPRLPECFRAYQEVIDRSMAKQPEDRYPDCRTFAAAIQAVSQAAVDEDCDTLILQAETRVLPQAEAQSADAHKAAGAEPRRQRRTPLLLGALALAVALGVGGYLLYPGGREQAPVEAKLAVATPTSVYRRYVDAMVANGEVEQALAEAASDFSGNPVDDYSQDSAKRFAELVDAVRQQGLATEYTAARKDMEKLYPGQAERGLTDRSVKDLLAEAARHLAAGRFTLPEDYNAVSLYRQVLLKDPDNSEARAKLKKMAQVLLRLAYEQLKLGNQAEAARLVESGLMVNPGDPELLKLVDRNSSPF